MAPSSGRLEGTSRRSIRANFSYSRGSVRGASRARRAERGRIIVGSRDVTLAGLQGETLAERFRLAELIGRGGYGAVFRAVQLSIHRTCAVKVLEPGFCTMDKTVKRFRREADMTSKLHHPNTVVVHDFGHDEELSVLFLAMEYMEGITLRKHVERYGPLGVEAALRVARQAAESLQEAHDLGMVHRDIKPHNLMLTSRGDEALFVKVIDFGIAKALQPELLQDGGETLTVTDHPVGTPQYMSPEQICSEAVEARTDQYALAVTMYYALSGQLPFEGDNEIQIATQHIEQTPPPLTSRAPGLELPRAFDETLLRALSKEPAERFDTVIDFVDALESAHDFAGDIGRAGEAESEDGTHDFPGPRIAPDASSRCSSTVETSTSSALECMTTDVAAIDELPDSETPPSDRELDEGPADEIQVQIGAPASGFDVTREVDIERDADDEPRADTPPGDEMGAGGAHETPDVDDPLEAKRRQGHRPAPDSPRPDPPDEATVDLAPSTPVSSEETSSSSASRADTIPDTIARGSTVPSETLDDSSGVIERNEASASSSQSFADVLGATSETSMPPTDVQDTSDIEAIQDDMTRESGGSDDSSGPLDVERRDTIEETSPISEESCGTSTVPAPEVHRNGASSDPRDEGRSDRRGAPCENDSSEWRDASAARPDTRRDDSTVDRSAQPSSSRHRSIVFWGVLAVGVLAGVAMLVYLQ